MAQYVLIQQEWRSTRFHCPVCGELVASDSEITKRPCSHVLFSWIDQTGEFYNLVPSLKGAAESDDFMLPSDEEFLDACPETAVLFAFKLGLMACGPVGLTIVHGIRFPEN